MLVWLGSAGIVVLILLMLVIVWILWRWSRKP